MKPNFEVQIDALKSVEVDLESSLPKLPDEVTYQNVAISTAGIIKSFSTLVKDLQSVSNTEIDPVLFAVHSPNIVSVASALVTHTKQFISQPITPYSDNLINHIWSMRSSLIYLQPTALNQNFTKWLFSQDGKKGTDELTKLSKSLELAHKQTAEVQKHLEETLIKATDLFSQAQADAQNASNSKTNAEGSALASLTSKQSADKVLEELIETQDTTNSLLEKIESLQSKAEKALASTSQVGLANSFNLRKSVLQDAQFWWASAFFFGLLMLLLMAVAPLLEIPMLHLPLIFGTDGSFDHWAYVARILLAGPVIWFTWFAARQYGRNVALIEDYAFKEASALAFVGYKKDMEEDAEMIKLLRKAAIHNFSNQPSRLITKSDASSPLHDLVEKVMEGRNLAKILAILKQYKKD